MSTRATSNALASASPAVEVVMATANAMAAKNLIMTLELPPISLPHIDATKMPKIDEPKWSNHNHEFEDSFISAVLMPQRKVTQGDHFRRGQRLGGLGK